MDAGAGGTIVISQFAEEGGQWTGCAAFGTYLVKAVQREEKDGELLLAAARRGEEESLSIWVG